MLFSFFFSGYAVKVPTNGGTYVNDYTLTMDVKLDSLPKDRYIQTVDIFPSVFTFLRSVSLYQANWEKKQTEGEAYISKSGKKVLIACSQEADLFQVVLAFLASTASERPGSKRRNGPGF